MGERFAGRYELVDILGSGGMGTVWRVWDEREQEFRAAKVLRQADATSLLRFVREQGVRIEWPHVLAPLGWAAEDDRVLFTMEIIGGGSLCTLIGDFGALPPAWTAVLLDQLLIALDGVHRHGLVHRDVKPANLLMRPTGKGVPYMLLGDFGVALPIGEPRLTQGSMLLGTPGYYVPEQRKGAEPDPRQDLYSAGMVAVEVLTGKRPESDDDEPVSLPSPRELGALAPVIERLTALRPEDRFQSAGEARAALAATGLLPPPGEVPFDGGLDIEILDQTAPALTKAPPVNAHQPSRRFGRRGVAVLAALLLLSGTAAAAMAFGSGGENTLFADQVPNNDVPAADFPAAETSLVPPSPESTTTSLGSSATTTTTVKGRPGTTTTVASGRNVVPGSSLPPATSTPTSTSNLVVNGDFESGVAGWYSSTGAAVVQAAGGHDSAGAARIRNELGTAKTSVLNDQTNSVRGAAGPGTYVANAWVRTDNPGVSVNLRLMQWSKERGRIDEANYDLNLKDTDWHQLAVQINAAGSDYEIDVNVMSWDLPPGYSFDVDGVTLRS